MTEQTLFRIKPDQDYRDDSLSKNEKLFDIKLVEDTA